MWTNREINAEVKLNCFNCCKEEKKRDGKIHTKMRNKKKKKLYDIIAEKGREKRWEYLYKHDRDWECSLVWGGVPSTDRHGVYEMSTFKRGECVCVHVCGREGGKYITKAL